MVLKAKERCHTKVKLKDKHGLFHGSDAQRAVENTLLYSLRRFASRIEVQ